MMRYAIVTGSTKGMGKAIGLRLLQFGYHVIFNYAIDEAAADILRTEISSFEGSYSIIHQALEHKSDVEIFVSDCLAISDTFDVIVCNAGCTDRSSWHDLTWEAWEHVMNVNINAPSYLLRLLDDHIRTGSGSGIRFGGGADTDAEAANSNIIFIGSEMAIYKHAMSIPYSVSKGAVHTLTEALVKVYAERGIRVNAIAPGFVDTPWQKNKPEQIRNNICNKIALHRFAEPDEIAQMVMSIIENGYINGSIIKVDGGYCYK